MHSFDRAALLLIDLQKAIDDPSWGQRNQPEAEATILALLARWRRAARPVIHVRHDSIDPRSTYRPGQAGHEFKPGFEPAPGETLIAKSTASAFIGTGLEAQLRARGLDTLVICGVITNNSVEATARMAGELGFHTYVVADGCFTFGRRDWSGVWRTAEEVHALSLANLDGEYAQIVQAAQVP
jgi:nicotinamidase-related amidase